MVEGLILFLQVHVLPWGALGVFVASVIEEVAAPIPSALIMTMSGFLLVSGPVSVSSISALVFKVALPAALGVTIGSYFIFFIAKYGGKTVIDSWGKYLGLYWTDIEKLQGKLSSTKKDEILIGVARVLPFFPSVAISAFCGILNMNVARYFLVSFVGIFFRGLILGSIGWQVGNVYEKYADYIKHIEDSLLYILFLIVLLFFLYKFLNKPKNK